MDDLDMKPSVRVGQYEYGPTSVEMDTVSVRVKCHSCGSIFELFEMAADRYGQYPHGCRYLKNWMKLHKQCNGSGK